MGLHIYKKIEQGNLLRLLQVRQGGVEVGKWGGTLINIKCKPIWNCYNDSPPYNEYILIKMKKKFTV
jgi:hypothetical protein